MSGRYPLHKPWCSVSHDGECRREDQPSTLDLLDTYRRAMMDLIRSSHLPGMMAERERFDRAAGVAYQRLTDRIGELEQLGEALEKWKQLAQQLGAAGTAMFSPVGARPFLEIRMLIDEALIELARLDAVDAALQKLRRHAEQAIATRFDPPMAHVSGLVLADAVQLIIELRAGDAGRTLESAPAAADLEQAALEREMRWDPETEERLLRELVPKLEPVYQQLRALLPPRTDVGILIGVRPLEGELWGRVIAMTTDRARVAALAGQWCLTALDGGKP